jgi:hypothetical protein
MPTLDDAPIQPVLSTLALTDKVQIFDVSAKQGSKVITVGELLEQAVGLLPTSAPATVGDLWLNSGVLTRKMS